MIFIGMRLIYLTPTLYTLQISTGQNVDKTIEFGVQAKEKSDITELVSCTFFVSSCDVGGVDEPIYLMHLTLIPLPRDFYTTFM